MKRLLRSIFDCGTPEVTQKHLLHNFTRLRDSKLKWEHPEDEVLYQYASAYFLGHFEMPSLHTVIDHFGPEGINDTEILERIKDVSAAKVYIESNFAHLLKQVQKRLLDIEAERIHREAAQIAHKNGLGIEGPDGTKTKIQGAEESFTYSTQRMGDLLRDQGGHPRPEDIRQNGQEVWDQYTLAKNHKDKVYGRFTGLQEIDTICHGLKNGEFHVHAAYAGELKTTLAMTQCYNLVTRYRTNVFYASFEMPKRQVQLMFYVMHSSHARWRAMGYAPLDYRKVRDGELTPTEENFYKEVIQDFTSNPEYCHLEVWAPDEDITVEAARNEATLLHKQMDVGFVVLDHGGNMEARRGKRNKDYVIELNSILRDAKKFALQFDGGRGVPVLMLFQINRQGKLEADKNDGIYPHMGCLSYGNEAERSADLVTTSYLNDDLRRDQLTKICCLKNRDNPLFKPFLAAVDFRVRKLSNYVQPELTGMSIDEV